jgi:hypothetical protein
LLPQNSPAASYYIVRHSTDGKSFDSGQYTTDTFANFTNLDNGPLDGGTTHYFTVSAGNENGISFPSEVVGVKIKQPNERKMLIVNGFDRLDNRINSVYHYSEDGLPPFENVSNEKNYAVIHGESVKNSQRGWCFDSASNEAITSEKINLNGYDAVDWYVGRESYADDTFSRSTDANHPLSEQAAVTNYLNAGGRMFISGTEIAWELDLDSWAAALNNTTVEDDAFLNDVLRTGYAEDDALTYNVISTSADGSPFNDVANFTIDDGYQGGYHAKYPDVFLPVNSSVGVFEYNGGTGGFAGILYHNQYQLVMIGFPFEVIVEDNIRTEIMSKILDWFDIDIGCSH